MSEQKQMEFTKYCNYMEGKTSKGTAKKTIALTLTPEAVENLLNELDMLLQECKGSNIEIFSNAIETKYGFSGFISTKISTYVPKEKPQQSFRDKRPASDIKAGADEMRKKYGRSQP